MNTKTIFLLSVVINLQLHAMDYSINATQQLMQLVTAWNAEQVEKALKLGTNRDCRDKDGNTPLILAAQADKTDIITLLLKYGADVNAQNKMEETALFSATSRKNPDVVKQLIAAGADTNIANCADESPLSFAAYKGHEEIIGILLTNTKTDVASVLQELKKRSKKNTESEKEANKKALDLLNKKIAEKSKTTQKQ